MITTSEYIGLRQCCGNHSITRHVLSYDVVAVLQSYHTCACTSRYCDSSS